MTAALDSVAQTINLVPNPGFEEISRCPGSLCQRASEFQVNHWRSVGIGTPDYFNACASGDGGVPYNWAGVSDAFEGNGYAGILVWMNTDNEDINKYREYLECKLLEPLIKDSVYKIEFHYKLSSYSPYSVDRIGLLLYDTLLYAGHDDVLEIPPTLSVIRDSALTIRTGLWEKATMEYKANGGEQYLVIGNFFNRESTRYYKIQFRPLSQPLLALSSYYYVDEVKVIPRYRLIEKPLAGFIPGFSLSHVEANTTYVLKNIRFKFDSYRLTASSFPQLDEIVIYLGAHPEMRVEVSGHTDDVGSDAYNLKLSRERAKCVAGYLASRGISENRIRIFGYGKSRPQVEPLTEESRAINRRVEIRFIQ